MEYRVKEVIFEEIKEDGSVGREETLTEHGWDLVKSASAQATMIPLIVSGSHPTIRV